MDVSRIVLRITGDSSDARRALREVAAEIQAVAARNVDAEVGVDTAKARAELMSMENALNLIGQRNVTARVNVNTTKARAELALLRRELALAERGTPGSRAVGAIIKDIDALGGKVAKMTGIGARVAGAVSTVFGKLGEGVGQATDALNTGALFIVKTLSTIFIAAIVLIPVITALLGVLGALFASFAAAAAGAAVLGTTLLTVLVPVIGVLVFAFVRLAKAIQAVQQRNKQSEESAKAVKDAEEQRISALNRLQDAQRNLSQTTLDAYRAQRDAAYDVRDAELSLQDARLGIEGANLRLERAQQNLKDLKDEAVEANPALAALFKRFEDVDYRISPDQAASLMGAAQAAGAGKDGGKSRLDVKEALHEIRTAQLGVKQAKLQEEGATNRLNDAQVKNNRFVREGIRAYEPYRNALNNVRDAQHQLAKATDDVRYKQEQRNKALAGVSKQEEQIAERVLALGNKIKRALGPALTPVMEGIIDLAEDFVDTLADARVSRATRSIGNALGGLFRSLGRTLGSREVRRLFADLGEGGAKLTRIFGSRIFNNFLVIMLRLARAALPYLIAAFDKVGAFAEGLEKSTRSGKSLDRFVHSVMESLGDWLRLIRAVARVFLAFIRNGKETGDGLVRTLTRMFNRLADFLNTDEGRAKVKKWLEDSINFAKDFAEALRTVWRVTKLIIDAVAKAIEGYKKLVGWITRSTEANDEAQYSKNKSAAMKTTEDVLQDRADSGSKRVPKALMQQLYSNLIAPREEGGAGMSKYDARKYLERRLRGMGLRSSFASGGIVPTRGGHGDNVFAMLEGGEGVIRRSAMQRVGQRALFMMNNGVPLSRIAAGAGSGTTQVDVHLPPAPAAAVPDARHQAAQLGKELRRRFK